MLIPKRKREVTVFIPVVAMADIAFLLIIFFLVTTTLNRDKGIGLILPSAGKTKPVPRKNICNVWVNAAGDIAVDGEEISLFNLTDEIKRRLSENNKLIVSLQSDRETPYRAFVAVLDELKLAGATRISIASPIK